MPGIASMMISAALSVTTKSKDTFDRSERENTDRLAVFVDGLADLNAIQMMGGRE